MPEGQHHASSHRLTRLASKLSDKAYRGSYVVHQTRQFLARQMRALRGEKSQKEFGEILGKPQSVVSRLEDPNYGKWALQSVFDVAISLDLAVIVRIVDYPTFLQFTSDMTDAAACPEAYKQDVVDSLASATSAMAAMAESMDQHKYRTNAFIGTAPHNQPANVQMVSSSSARSAAWRPMDPKQGTEARPIQ